MTAQTLSARSLVSPVALKLSLASTDLVAAIRELVNAFPGDPVVTDRGRLRLAFEERLALGANCMTPDVAIPHARTTAVRELTMVAGRSPVGLRIDDQHPNVRIVFLIAAPPPAINDYLRQMAALSQRLRQPQRVAALLAASSSDEFERVLMAT